MSDERIGEAVIQEVIQEELRDAAPAEVPPLTPLGVTTVQDRKMVTQLGKMIRIIGDRVKDDKEFQDAIDGVSLCGGSRWESFREVAERVFQQGITWERIAVLVYVAGRLAVRMVESHLPQSVRDILRWTVDFFRANLLSWIREHGGWINSFSELATASVDGASSMTSSSYGFILIFIMGMALGSFITWRATRRL